MRNYEPAAGVYERNPEKFSQPSEEFSRLAVVNGKPFGDMYFKNYGVNPTIDTEEENVSTFSVDVDTASYTLARSYLARGRLPEEDGDPRGGVHQRVPV